MKVAGNLLVLLMPTVLTLFVPATTAEAATYASNPQPPNGAVDVPLTVDTLRWDRGEDARERDLYFGTEPTLGPDTYVGRLETVYYDFNPEPGTTYYWRVDEVDHLGRVPRGAVWSFTTEFLAAHTPEPSDRAVFVDPDADLAWRPASFVLSHDVYFGTDETAVAQGAPDTFRGNQAGTSYDPGPLATGTTYYWRIDGVEADGTKRVGEVWSFTTLPLTAHSPVPVDGEGRVHPTTALMWGASHEVASHNVYFGTDRDAVADGRAGTSKGNQAATTYDPGLLQTASAYYWRIDEVQADGTIYPGQVWSFTTATLIASSPHPPDGAESVDPRTDLTWISGDTAVSHYVYLSWSEPAVVHATRDAFRVNQWATTYAPGSLELGTTYYWRIDEIEPDGTRHPGEIWHFTTSPKPIDLEIVGPDDVWAQSSTQYAALVRYEDDTTVQVTTSATWWLDTVAHASIDQTGLLTAEATDEHEIITIRARYTEEQITVDAEKAVSHIPLIPGRVIYHVDRVNGNDSHSGLTAETAFATIQNAIDTAHDGDTILIHPGIYTEMIDFVGKAVTVQSAAEAAIIECPGDFAVSFYSGEGRDTVLRNIVIRNSMMGVFVTNSSPTITNVIITGNRYGLKAYGSAEPDISNCIFWDNFDGDLFGCSARYSWLQDDAGAMLFGALQAEEVGLLFQNGVTQHDLAAGPMFVDADNDDYHLLSERGRYWPEQDAWILDEVTSPCIDAGDPTADYSNEPAPNGGRINIGAYGGTEHASMSDWPIEWDFNYDRIVNFDDLLLLIEKWLNHVDWAAQ